MGRLFGASCIAVFAVSLITAPALGSRVGIFGSLPRACEPPDRAGPPTHRSPGPALLRTLGVLRRPQEPADLPAHHAFFEDDNVRVLIDYVRLVDTAPDGRRYFLVPVVLRVHRLSHRCLAEATPQERQFLLETHRFERRRAGQVLVGEEDFDPDGNGGGSGYSSAADIRRDGGGMSATVDRRGQWIDGFVPDGVATVTLRWHGGGRAQSQVHENHWLVRTSRRGFSAFDVTILWRDATGRIVKVIPRRRDGFASRR